MSSLLNKSCNGCEHKEDIKSQWCYMFEKQPDILPCCQHDKYKEQCQIMGRKIRENPSILLGMLENERS